MVCRSVLLASVNEVGLLDISLLTVLLLVFHTEM